MYKSAFQKCVAVGLSLPIFASALSARPGQPAGVVGPPQGAIAPTRANILRGEYGRYRASNDLLFYHLDVRVDPERKFLSGKNTIRFKMLRDDTRIQLDLHEALRVDKILFPVSNVGGLVPGSKT